VSATKEKKGGGNIGDLRRERTEEKRTGGDLEFLSEVPEQTALKDSQIQLDPGSELVDFNRRGEERGAGNPLEPSRFKEIGKRRGPFLFSDSRRDTGERK